MSSVTIDRCPVCHTKIEKPPASTGNWFDVDCPECGGYRISWTTAALFEEPEFTLEQRRAKLERAKKRAAPGQKPFIRDIL